MAKVMSGVTLSESTVERTTEDTGRELVDAYESGWTPTISAAWKWPLDALNRRMACVQIDATGVGIQGDGGQKAPGRMVWVGAISNAAVQREALPDESTFRPRTRYVAGLCPLAEMGPLLRSQAASVGMEHVDGWIALSDGGQGLEEFLRVYFPRVEAVIIDYWHVSEYLAKLAEAAYPSDETAREALRREWGELLREEGGWTTLNVLREYEPPSRTKLWKSTWATVQTYLENHASRMEYPEYLAKGWIIGSGLIEGACKKVIGARLKGPRRWSEKGAHEMAMLRSLFCSDPGAWESFWNRHQ